MKRCLVGARITWLAAILCPVANPAFSQLITADIVGTVSDPAGAIIVGSVVRQKTWGRTRGAPHRPMDRANWSLTCSRANTR
jgi:hypothetical protein